MYQSVPQEIMFIPAQKLLKNSMSLWNYYLCPLPLCPNPTTAKAWESQGYLATGLKLHKRSMPGCHGSVCLVALSLLLIPPPSQLFFASSHFFLGPDYNGSPFLLWNTGEALRSRKWPFGEGWECPSRAEGQGAGGGAGFLSRPAPTQQCSWAGDRWQFAPGIGLQQIMTRARREAGRLLEMRLLPSVQTSGRRWLRGTLWPRRRSAGTERAKEPGLCPRQRSEQQHRSSTRNHLFPNSPETSSSKVHVMEGHCYSWVTTYRAWKRSKTLGWTWEQCRQITEKCFNSSQKWGPRCSAVYPLYRNGKKTDLQRSDIFGEQEWTLLSCPLATVSDFFFFFCCDQQRCIERVERNTKCYSWPPIKYQHRNPVQTMHGFVYSTPAAWSGTTAGSSLKAQNITDC